ncbi:MAG: EamA family transporter [Candidatus Methanomethylophilaceae archaeon]|nr:EamA family transporter [Candidatus Methanomethylophilaceae archaeon]
MTSYSEHLGILAALSAGIVWGLLGFFVRTSDDLGISPMQLTCLRYIMIFAIVCVYIMVRNMKLFKVNRRTVFILLLMGLIGTILNSVTYLESMTLISLSLSSVLQYVAPFFVILISVPLLKEKLTLNKILAVIGAFVGSILCTGVLTDPGSMNLWGIFLAALSGFCFSVYTVGSKILSKDGYSVSTVLLYTSLICWVGLAPFCDLPGAFDLMIHSTDALLIVIGMGLFVTLLPFVLFNYSLTKIEAGKASILTYAEPLAATVIGLIIYGEGVGIDTATGITLILLALIVINRKENPGNAPGE